MKKQKINTMEELSLAIGVSRPTLSRYFQNSQSVRHSTVAKIRLGLERVDYVPNFFATRLNRKTTGLIGVIVPHLNDLFYTSLLEVIQRAATAADFTIITQSSLGDPEIEAHAVSRLISMSADGVIVSPLASGGSAAAFETLTGRLPCVFVDARQPDILPPVDFVGTDNQQSIGLIIDYLCRTGDAPVYLSMPKLNFNAAEREAVYIAQMQARGLQPEIVSSNQTPESWHFEAYAYEIMDRHFSRGNFRCRTLLCANDRLAIGAIRAANYHGLFSQGPDSGTGFRIAGHDDHPLSRFMTPSLTTVTQDIEAIGTTAIDVLVKRITGKENGDDHEIIRSFDAVLQVRESA